MQQLQQHRWALLAMVTALAGVSATSVALAIAALIENTLLAVLFASAAVVLDLFKYIAWPFALGLLEMRRTVCALLMMASALALGGVSAWASYDRLMTSIVTSRAELQARQTQRKADLIEQRGADAARIQQLDAEAVTTREQANALRDRGMVTRALELEGAAMARIDSERGQAQVRRDNASQELTALLAKPAKAAGHPPLPRLRRSAGSGPRPDSLRAPTRNNGGTRSGSSSRETETARRTQRGTLGNRAGNGRR
ncbi:hypothetical protein [Pseudomonas sp. PSE14]|uniref:hypothetical protein n=1 Tax=Pseudomonas sp. PSE14 TaxID=3016341 RepID=UPI0023D831AA|nr:hypothetical protein [Pseudomonas sp. PSE14]WEJ70361.1 hypothetical protein O6P39_16965 [Pseudomonas sp. PSE14]